MDKITHDQATEMGMADGLMAVQAFIAEPSNARDGLLAGDWEEAARNADAAGVRNIPAALSDAYYRAYRQSAAAAASDEHANWDTEADTAWAVEVKQRTSAISDGTATFRSPPI